ncbi:hypothetical protein Q31b_34120 [Novipirellula aureliae]|uniref:Uncharacterized protein n=1 Tax=Novipirellula aureliae TaxID=2527966 RepID=A0A5C6DTH4_9BACT|nr:hypothetical protein [Novipirellula aureliae]TWU40068.1 hypothetical protein Q31b_34120 [Novipirellula aureliae]
MKRFKNILVATDTRLPVQTIVNQAAQFASADKANLKLVTLCHRLHR